MRKGGHLDVTGSIEAEIHPETEGPVAGARTEAPWPAWMAFTTAWWLPATTARRTQHVRLSRAFGVHLAASVLSSLLIVVLIAWIEVGPNRGSLANRVAYVIGEMAEDYGREWNRWPLETILATVGVILLVEAGFVALALLVAPWGAADEPFRATIANGLRQTWLHTVDALPGALLVGLIAMTVYQASDIWYARTSPVQPVVSSPPQAPPLPQGVATAAEWEEYREKQQAYLAELNAYRTQQSRAWGIYYNQLPWHVRHRDEIVGFSSTGAAIWLLWALMRAVGARRTVPGVRRPPICETCGYNLTTLPMEARCPECGEPVVDSLGPAVRPGAPWERRRDSGPLRAYWHSAVGAFVRPAWLGLQLRVSSWIVAHRLFLVAHVLPLFFVGYATLLGCYYADMRRNPFVHERELVYIAAPVLGIALASGVLVGSLVFPGLIGLWVGSVYKRNLVPAAMQMAGYLIAFVAGCCVISGVLAVAMFLAAEEKWFNGLGQALDIDDGLIAFFGWLGPSLAMVLVYLVLLYRGTQAARYANR